MLSIKYIYIVKQRSASPKLETGETCKIKRGGIAYLNSAANFIVIENEVTEELGDPIKLFCCWCI